MFDGNEYFADENAAVEDEYARVRDVVRGTYEVTRDADAPWSAFVHRSTRFLIGLADLEARQDSSQHASLDELAADNDALYVDFIPESYSGSFADPAYASGCLGTEVGPLVALITARWRRLTEAAYFRQRFRLSDAFRRLLEIASLGEDGVVSPEALRETIVRHSREDRTLDFDVQIRRQWDPAFRFARDIAETAEPGDLRALFRYGERVTPHDLRTARFIAELPQDEVDRIADALLTAYLRGFEIGNKDIFSKSSVSVVGRLGYERIFARLFAALDREGLASCYVALPAVRLNQQLAYDHRFDYSIFIDRDLVEAQLGTLETVLDRLSEMLRAASGVINLMVFGEPPFTPVLKDACFRADADTAALDREFKARQAQLANSAAPREEKSFTIVAFPSPEIRGSFETIFADMLEINTLQNDHYARIQHTIIAALDRAESIRVIGREGNRTDLMVTMQDLVDPTRQTNFVNCVADVNIPVGEVFTSPRLSGSSGVLHVEEAFLEGLRYQDIEITFRDGCITDYTCGNFEDEAESRKYVLENLLYPHDSLPIGEFAIGTNTLAYAMAKRHGIMDLLPVLIIEKMGPHLAIGDTCFSWQEDHVIRNPLDGKEVVARENERSRQRKEDPSKAYTNTHVDITLPYSSLGTIVAVLPSGEEVEIIRDGRFVLPGTEELNAAIDEVDR